MQKYHEEVTFNLMPVFITHSMHIFEENFMSSLHLLYAYVFL